MTSATLRAVAYSSFFDRRRHRPRWANVHVYDSAGVSDPVAHADRVYAFTLVIGGETWPL